MALIDDWGSLDSESHDEPRDAGTTVQSEVLLCDEDITFAACEQLTDMLRMCSIMMWSNESCIHVFHSAEVPAVLPAHYLWSLLCNMQATKSVLVVSCIYIDRFLERTGYPVNDLTIHRLLLCSTILAHQWMEDVTFTSKTLARFGGVGPRELNRLLSFMCRCLGWKLHVDIDCYKAYGRLLNVVA